MEILLKVYIRNINGDETVQKSMSEMVTELGGR